MIRIELKPRSSFHRRLGIVAGLAVAAAAFGGALYTLDRQVPLGSMWGQAAESVARSSVPPPTPMDDGVRQAMEPPDLPSSSDATLRSLSLLARLPAAMKVTTLTADAGGDFVIEGNLAGANSLVETLDSLRPYTTDVRGTSWTSGPQGVAPAACRIVGEVAVSGGAPLQPVPATKAARLFEQVGERAVASGLPAVQSGPARVEAAGSGLSVHHLELRAEGPSIPLRRFVQDLADLGTAVRIAHLVVVRSPDDDAYSQITLSLDAVVRESPPGGSP
jgi:hypothetical protein